MLLKYASIIKHYRQQLIEQDEFFKDLFRCSLCLGVWVGMLHTIFAAIDQGPQWIFLLLPGMSAGLAWFVDCALQLMQAATKWLKVNTSAET